MEAVLVQTTTALGTSFGHVPHRYPTTFCDDGVIPLTSRLRLGYTSAPVTLAGFLAAVPRLLRDPYFVYATQAFTTTYDVPFGTQMVGWFEQIIAAVHGDEATVKNILPSLTMYERLVLPGVAHPAWLSGSTYSLAEPVHLLRTLLPLITMAARAHMSYVPTANDWYVRDLATVVEHAFGVKLAAGSLTELNDLLAANDGRRLLSGENLHTSGAINLWNEWYATPIFGVTPAELTYQWTSLLPDTERNAWGFSAMSEARGIGSIELGKYGRTLAQYLLGNIGEAPTDEIFVAALR